MGVKENRRRWREKQKSLGNCRECGEPTGGHRHCELHRAKHRDYCNRYLSKTETEPKRKALLRKRKARDAYGDLWDVQVLILCIMDLIKQKEKANDGR